MALQTSKVSIDEVTRRCNLKTDTFDALSHDARTLEERIVDAQREQTAYVQRQVGASGYAGTTEPKHTCIRAAEERLIAADVIEQLITEIAGVPDTVAHTDADLAALEAQIERYRDRAAELLGPYIVSTDEGPMNVLFSVGSTGVDETARDVYPEIDFGNLEERR